LEDQAAPITALLNQNTMNNRLSNESQHEKYLVEGMQYLQANVNNVDKAFLEFSAGCARTL